MELPTWITCFFYCRLLLHILTTRSRILWIVLTQNRSYIRKLWSTKQGKATVIVYQSKTFRRGVGSMAANSYTATENVFKLRDFITRACRKSSKPRLKFPMIKAGASNYCLRPFRRQILVTSSSSSPSPQ